MTEREDEGGVRLKRLSDNRKWQREADVAHLVACAERVLVRFGSVGDEWQDLRAAILAVDPRARVTRREEETGAVRIP